MASGSGTNAENIIKYFSGSDIAEVALVLSNRSDAYVLKRAENWKVPGMVFSREDLISGKLVHLLKERKIDMIVLAGFLWLIPGNMVEEFRGRIVNIHPALLPKYGGKGMYGDRVHQAVRDNEEAETGITIHLVDERYDEGDVLFQTSCPVLPGDSPGDIATKVHALEYQYYPKVIESMAKNL